MNDARRELEDKLLDRAADELRQIVASGGENLTVAVGQQWAQRQLVRSVAEKYPQQLARQILANPDASSTSIFLKTINALAGNSQRTALFANKIAPIVGKYFAVIIDPALTWFKMSRDDHTTDEIVRAMAKSLLVGMVKTSASAGLGPIGGTAASIGIDAFTRHRSEH
jgi:hypothetical protein